MDEIDEALLAYYRWTVAYTPALGYGKADPACRNFRTSRQWMTPGELGEEVDAKIEAEIGKRVEPLVMELHLRQRVAVNVACRNFETGAQVWRNPVHPETQDQDYAAAKEALRPGLESRNIIEKAVLDKRLMSA
jgi:hypothetical protein